MPEASSQPCQAALIPLDKKAGKIRPIAIGITFRRLATKALIPKAIAEAKGYLLPLQVGCGASCGADEMVHDARESIEEHGHDPAYILTSADAENAFNKTSRAEMLRQTTEHAPSLIRLANALYAKNEPYLKLGEVLIRSREGTQQGDPASGLLFALAIHEMVKKIDNECDLHVHRWYADDRMIGGRISEVRKALPIIAEEGAKLNLILQPNKSKAYCQHKTLIT